MFAELLLLQQTHIVCSIKAMNSQVALSFSRRILSFSRIHQIRQLSTAEKGLMADIIPVKFTATEGKTYFWCSCGESKKQPFCDGTHKRPDIKLRPIKWETAKSKDYWLCNCKQTAKGPYCDGTHKKEEIKEAFKKQQTGRSQG